MNHKSLYLTHPMKITRDTKLWTYQETLSESNLIHIQNDRQQVPKEISYYVRHEEDSSLCIIITDGHHRLSAALNDITTSKFDDLCFTPVQQDTLDRLLYLFTFGNKKLRPFTEIEIVEDEG